LPWTASDKILMRLLLDEAVVNRMEGTAVHD